MNVEENNSNSVMSEVDVDMKMTAEEVKEMVLQHLADKYGKQFRCVTMREPHALSDNYRLICSEEGKTSEADQFKAIYTPNRGSPIQDGYFGFTLNNLVVNEIDNLDSVEGKNIKVFAAFFFAVFPEELTQESTISDAVNSMGEVESDIYVFCREPLDLEQMAKECKALGLVGQIHYYQVDEKLFESIMPENYEHVVSNIVAGKVKPIARIKVEIK